MTQEAVLIVEDVPDTVLVLGGEQGLSAYEIAVRNGFIGTEAQWVEAILAIGGYTVTVTPEYNKTFTVGPGGVYATQEAAMQAASAMIPYYVEGKFAGRILLKSGYVMEEQVALAGMNFGFLTIESEDPTVTISRAALTAGQAANDYDFATNANLPNRRAAYFGYHGAVLPRIGVKFVMDETGVDDTTAEYVGILVHGSHATILEGCGVANVKKGTASGGRGLNATHCATVTAWGSEWENCQIGFRIANSSLANIREASAPGCQIGLDVNGNSIVSAQAADFSGAVGTTNVHAIWASSSSTVKADGANLANCAVGGTTASEFVTVLAESGARVSIDGCDLSGGQRGMEATGDATIIWRNGVVTSMAGQCGQTKMGGRLICDYAAISGVESEGVLIAFVGGEIFGKSMVLSDNPSVSGIYAYGGKFFIPNTSVTGSKLTGGDKDIRIRDGGEVYIHGGETTNGSGSISMGDTSLSVPNIRYPIGLLCCELDFGAFQEHQLGRSAGEIAAAVQPTKYGHGYGVVPRYTAPQDALAASNVVSFPGASYANAELEIPGSRRIVGDGSQSQLAAGFRVDPDATGAVNLDVEDLYFSGGAGLAADQACLADIKARVENLDSVAGSSLVALRNSGKLTALVRGVRGKDLTSVGVALGWNDYAASLNWGPAIITDVIVDGLFPDDSASHYGIISYLPNSVISNYVVRNVGNTGGGAGTEGVYTKAKGSVIANGVHVDGGLDEGMLNIKGSSKGGTNSPLGYNVVALGHVFEWSSAYTAADGDPTTLTGANLANDNILFGAALFFNGSGRAIHTASAEIDSGGIFDVAILDGTYADGGIYHQNSGRGHTVRGATIRNINGPGLKTRGASSDSTFDYSDVLIDGALYGWLIRPSADNVADYLLQNSQIRATTGAAILFDGGFKPRSLTLVNVGIGDFRSRATFNYDTTAIVPLRWFVRNLYGYGNTADAALRNVASFKVPQGKPIMLAVRVSASDGTNVFMTERRAVLLNTAGTVALQGSVQTIGEVNPGAVTWDLQFNISSELVQVQVKGAAATSVNWQVSIDADTP